MAKLIVKYSKCIEDKINHFEDVRKQRVEMLKRQHPNNDAQFSYAVSVDPLINQIDSYLLKIYARAIPETIEIDADMAEVLTLNK